MSTYYYVSSSNCLPLIKHFLVVIICKSYFPLDCKQIEYEITEKDCVEIVDCLYRTDL